MNLEKVLESHKDFLTSDAKKGKRANLSGANLIEANLSPVDLRGANLRGANLRGANLRGTNFIGADLKETNLKNADLRWVNFRGADLRGANLQDADLRRASNISIASFDKRGYELIAWKYKGEFWFNAGCMSFSHKDALKHWGSPEYPDKIRGKAYCKAIKFLMETWPWE